MGNVEPRRGRLRSLLMMMCLMRRRRMKRRIWMSLLLMNLLMRMVLMRKKTTGPDSSKSTALAEARTNQRAAVLPKDRRGLERAAHRRALPLSAVRTNLTNLFS